LAEVEKGVSKEQEISTDNRLKIIESDKNILFETYDNQSRDQWIHKNMIKKYAAPYFLAIYKMNLEFTQG
jgi:hypothetical protein